MGNVSTGGDDSATNSSYGCFFGGGGTSGQTASKQRWKSEDGGQMMEASEVSVRGSVSVAVGGARAWARAWALDAAVGEGRRWRMIGWTGWTGWTGRAGRATLAGLWRQLWLHLA